MSNNNMPVVGIVCGPSCSGKTTVITKMKQTFGDDITTICSDWFYNTGNSSTNFDHPDSIDWNLLNNCIDSLINNQECYVPQYDFKTHSRTTEQLLIKPTKIIIVEGILLFTNEELKSKATMKIFIKSSPELLTLRRIKRDTEERGRDIAEIEMRIIRDVMPSTQKFVMPHMFDADIILMNNSNNKVFVGLEIVISHIKLLLQK